jgi:hypothetical protein
MSLKKRLLAAGIPAVILEEGKPLSEALSKLSAHRAALRP